MRALRLGALRLGVMAEALPIWGAARPAGADTQFADADTQPGILTQSQSLSAEDWDATIGSMPPLLAGKTTIAELVRWSITKFGGPVQALRTMTQAEVKLFALWLGGQIPKLGNVAYWGVEEWKAAGRLEDSTTGFIGVPTDLGFDLGSSSKPFALATTCLDLAGEMDKDGMVTETEPMLCFVRDGYEPESGNFKLGHVKGLARSGVFLFPLACVFWQQKAVQPGLKVADVFPKLLGTGSKIHFRLFKFTTLSAVALKNAQLSQRGSLRKAHCVIVWVSSLDKHAAYFSSLFLCGPGNVCLTMYEPGKLDKV